MDSDEISKRMLTYLGYEVEVIPVSTVNGKREADFLVHYRGQTGIVESKLKEDDPLVERQKENKISSGDVAIIDGCYGRNETYSGILKKADRQLKSSSERPHDFKIISMICVGSNINTKMRQFMDTIYGCTSIIEGDQEKICYFYRNSDFFRRKSIDAAIVGALDYKMTNVLLCLNPYSASYGKLKNSAFVEPFGNNVLDPYKLESEGLAYIPDPGIERRLSRFQEQFPLCNPILRHLREKYKTGYLIAVDYLAPEISIER